MQKTNKPIEMNLSFGSSHGTVVTDEKGNVLKDLSTLSEYLLDIKKVDVVEVRKYLKEQGFESADEDVNFDILHVGYWDFKGEYIPPDEEYRNETLTRTDLVVWR
eukprot:TRINITY_DN640328_c0_g1_i2.p1 TRINITY_DN640328_c0_g1~~TRINITY_DN640328_c0_g1_i2.p1  ORF type:complete len:105 (-),score=24.08 TRINITY_DN640328_c0_g1_i2:22-336(-)